MVGTLKSRDKRLRWSIVKVFGLLSNSVMALVLQAAFHASETRSLVAYYD
jgi:hypothetical protein